MGDGPVSEWTKPPRTGRFAQLGGSTFSSLKYRNFRLFFVGQLISPGRQLADAGRPDAAGAQPHRQRRRARRCSPPASSRPVLLLGAWAGLVADRSDKRKLLMIVQAIAMVQSFALAALAFMDTPAAGRDLRASRWSAGSRWRSTTRPAGRSWSRWCPRRTCRTRSSLNSALMTSSRVIGPALAGLLITTVGFGWCFLLDGVSYIAVLVALCA